MSIRRILGVVGLVTSTLLAGAAPFAAAQHAGAAKLVTVKGDGFSIQIPSNWKYEAKVPLKQLFTTPALQKLASTAVVGETADTLDSIAVFVQHASLTSAAIQKVEALMFKEATGKILKAPAYSTKSNGVVTGQAVEKLPSQGNKTYGISVVAQSRGGVTLYLLLSVAQGYAADAQEVSTAVQTLG